MPMFQKTFAGGVHLSERKELTVDKKIRAIPAPDEIVLPLRQHIGAPNEPLVKVGDAVRIGQRIGEAKAFVSAHVHSPVSGKVRAFGNYPNPVYGKGPALLLENDGKYESLPFARRDDIEGLSGQELINIVKDAGIVGLGGAAFPTHVKLNIPEGKNVENLIINGAECEPYLTCDHRLMVEKTNKILRGIHIIAGILGVKNIFLAIEENKLSAIFAMEKAVRRMKGKSPHALIQIIVLKTKYPQGCEKQLVKAVLKKEIPPGKLPMDVGVVAHNVGTCLAVFEAVSEGKPLMERCATFTGSCLKDPGNFSVRFGTPLRYVADYCGGFRERPCKIIAGGPMMGVAQYTLDAPFIKGITGVLFLSEKDAKIPEELSCIRCARCVDICTVNLIPTDIMRMVKHSRWHYLDNLYSADCLECGACSYVCPSKIPLVQYIKLAKIKGLEKK